MKIDNAQTAAARGIPLIEISEPVVEKLASIKPASLQGAFSDYRPPREERIGLGDSIQITLWEAAAGGLFSSPVIDRSSAGTRSAVIPAQVVANDGAITVPFAGRVEVVNHTPPDVERVIVRRLADKAIDPQAVVTVVQSGSNAVTVLREGGTAAEVPLNLRGTRLLEVLALSGGGGSVGNSDTSVQLTREGKTTRVPLSAIIADPVENIYLQPGDVITLLRDPQTFIAAGALAGTGVIAFQTPTLTLDQALARAGGLLDEKADPSAIFLIRYEQPAILCQFSTLPNLQSCTDEAPAVYHLNLRDPSGLILAHRFPVRRNDVIYVANSNFNDIQKVLNLVNLLLSPGFTAASVTSSLK